MILFIILIISRCFFLWSTIAFYIGHALIVSPLNYLGPGRVIFAIEGFYYCCFVILYSSLIFYSIFC